MFAFADTPVRFVGLLLLFAWCTLWSAYELTRPQDARQRISNALHLLMAVVMLLMVSPATWTRLVAVVPTFALVGLFALSTAWFVWLAIEAVRGSDRNGGLHFSGHAAMFGAMTWHLAAMAVMQTAMSHGMGMGSGPGSHPGGMNKGEWMTAQSVPGGTLWIFALVGVPLMAYLLVSSLRSLWQAVRPRTAPAASACSCGPDCTCGPECSCRVNHPDAMAREPELVSSGGTAPVPLTVVAPATSTHSCHEVRPVGTAKYRLEAIAAFAMNFGMFWMSTGLMVPILPFFRLLAF
ncbi:MAG: DUF5134 domain-containing protein [Propionibacteriaceae bacterium]|nr:DUF5134 domain-containing protein [Propionibacteriaceae bacterium]